MPSCNVNNSEGDQSGTEQLATIVVDNGHNCSYPNTTIAPCGAEPIGSDKEQSKNLTPNGDTVQATGNCETYAEVAARQSPPASQRTAASCIRDTLTNDKPPIDVEDGFKGVERRRNRVKRLFLSGIAEQVEEKHIRAYMEKRNVNPTYISILKSRREGTVSAKVNIRASDAKLVSVEKFWPKFIQCKPWRSNDKRSNDKRSAERGSNAGMNKTSLPGNLNSTGS